MLKDMGTGLDVCQLADTEQEEDNSHTVWTRQGSLGQSHSAGQEIMSQAYKRQVLEQEKRLAAIWQWKEGSLCKHRPILQLCWG